MSLSGHMSCSDLKPEAALLMKGWSIQYTVYNVLIG